MEKDGKQLIIGSRDSLLAVRQSGIVLDYLRMAHPEMCCQLLTMKTTGDRILEKRLDEIGGKGLFVKELDIALRDGRSDLSVHSLKDMPAEIPEDLPVIGFSGREDPRDVLVLPEGISDISQADLTKPVGTSSRRRTLQAQELFPRARFESVRGNVQTRLRKLDEGQYCALILAAAGLRRLGLDPCRAEGGWIIHAWTVFSMSGLLLRQRLREPLSGLSGEDAPPRSRRMQLSWTRTIQVQMPGRGIRMDPVQMPSLIAAPVQVPTLKAALRGR